MNHADLQGSARHKHLEQAACRATDAIRRGVLYLAGAARWLRRDQWRAGPWRAVQLLAITQTRAYSVKTAHPDR
jgi:hypothetical protein